MPLTRPGRRGAALLLRSACGTLPHSRRLPDACRLPALSGSSVRLLLTGTRVCAALRACALRPGRRRLRPWLLCHKRSAGSLLVARRSRRLLATSPVSARTERPATARRPAPAATPSLWLLVRLWTLSSGRWHCLLAFRFPRAGAVRFRPIRIRPRVSKLKPTERAGGRTPNDLGCLGVPSREEPHGWPRAASGPRRQRQRPNRTCPRVSKLNPTERAGGRSRGDPGRSRGDPGRRRVPTGHVGGLQTYEARRRTRRAKRPEPLGFLQQVARIARHLEPNCNGPSPLLLSAKTGGSMNVMIKTTRAHRLFM